MASYGQCALSWCRRFAGVRSGPRRAVEILKGPGASATLESPRGRSVGRNLVDAWVAEYRLAFRAVAIAFDVEAPRAYEANPGIVEVRAGAPIDRIEVLVDGRPYRRVTLRFPTNRPRIGPIGLPPRDLRLTVRAYAGGEMIGKQTIDNVLGLPANAFAVGRSPRVAVSAQAALDRLARPPGTSAVWMADLTSGTGASRNAGASFTAASTVKLPIMITALADQEADAVGSPLWGPLQRMIRFSSNDAANEVLESIGGSEEAGGLRSTIVARRLGARDTHVAAGYLPGERRPRRAIPADVESQPEVPCCKRTTARDLGVMLRALVLAADGRGPAAALGLTPRDARVALWLLAHTSFRGLIARWTPYVAAFKEGNLERAWHEAAIVFGPSGPVAFAILTDDPAGASERAAAAYGRRIYRVAIRQLRIEARGNRAGRFVVPAASIKGDVRVDSITRNAPLRALSS